MRSIFFFTVLSLIYIQPVVSQYIQRPPDGNQSIISVEGNDGAGVYSADQFESDFGVGGRVLLQVTFYGLGEEILQNLLGFNVYIFEDAGGIPAGTPQTGNALISLPLINDHLTINSSGNSFDVTVDLLGLIGWQEFEPGTYWICAYPTVNLPTPTIFGEPGRWDWQESLSPSPAPSVEPVLIDPQDLFDLGATSWSNISGLISEPFSSFAWELETDVLIGFDDYSILDRIQIYPNPVGDILNVSLPEEIELENAYLLDTLGRQIAVELKNDQLDTSGYSSGIYSLRLITSKGQHTVRIIKH